MDQLPVVLKKFNKGNPSPIDLSRFRREFSIAMRFNHPGIIQAYDIHEAVGGSLFIAMEDCGGESVHRYFDRFQDLTIEEQLNIACRMAECIEQIHALKIIHMDINPANIVWCPDYDLIKIIDFGISTELSPEIEFVNPSALEGTLAYMSPEQTGRMNRPIDYRTDLYSLGITFYELFTGRLPFLDNDPLALIHSHIAVIPVEASKINKSLPDAVSQIIAKLMAKDADDRYQSAAGVKHDLQYCINCLTKSSTIGVFKIASNDVSPVFKVPQKLYFRQQENSMLISKFDEVCKSGQSRLMLVAGNSGIGKSVFVREIVKYIITKKAFYISGKFGEMEHAMPHAVIIQAFSGFFEQLLSDTEERLTYWRNRINKAVYPNGRIITDVIPIAKYIITNQPELLQLEPKEAQNRFNQCFFNLINVLSDSKHPLVFFLDDLQWADDSIFNLLDALLLKIKYLYVIGAYRSNEVSDTHPLKTFLHSVSQSNIVISRINLLPFDSEQTTRFVFDAFGRKNPTACELAEILFLKTQGNPFFLIQTLYLLYSHGAIHSDSSGNWIWESSASKGLINDIAELMISKMRLLSHESQHILIIAACIGSQVSLDKLIIASGFNHNVIVPYLEDLVSQGFITASSTFKYIHDADGLIEVNFRFLHDRIHQAAYRLIEDSTKFHLKIGLRFWDKLNEDDSNLSVFDVVKQCNRALDLLPYERRIPLAELNLKAGLRAKNTAAWNQAAHFFLAGLKLLKEHDWYSSYKLAHNLHSGCAETALLASDFKLVDTLCETILCNAHSLIDKCVAWDIQIMARIAQGNSVGAVQLGLQALHNLGIKIKTDPPKIFLVLSLLKMKLLLKKISGVNADSKIMTSSKHLAVARLLMRISTPAYASGSAVFISIVLQSVQMLIKYGYSSYTAFALTGLGGLFGIMGDHSSAQKFGRLALSFVNREDTKPIAARTVFVTTAFIAIYNVPYKDLLPNLLEHYKIGIETGDLEYAAYNVCCYCYLRFMSGDKLSVVHSLMSEYADDFKSQETVANFFRLYQQLFQNLLGKSDDPLVLTGDACDENKIKQHMEDHKNEVGLFTFYTQKMMLAFLFYNYSLAIDASQASMHYIQAAKTQHSVPIAVFYQTLTIFALLKSNVGHAYLSFQKILKRNIRKMKKWSNTSSSSFSHKYKLLMAEFFAIKGDYARAEKCYHKSVRLAKDSGIRHEIAITIELMALFYKQQGYEDIYRDYMRAAYRAYRKWGAIAKCNALKKRYNDIFKTDASENYFRANEKNRNDPAISTFMGTTTQQENLNNIDLLSVLKANQLISGEIDINSLSKKLLKIVLENAGAQKGSLIFLKENSLKTESICCMDEHGQAILKENPEDEIVYPEKVVNYVARTRKYVVIGDAVHDYSVHCKDPYIQSHQVRSVLCMPLIRNDAVIAILYLDNSVASNAFTEDRIKVLELLSAQAAISIENAKLYTIQMEKKLAESKAAAKSQFLAHMSHEIRTPLNSILAYSGLIKESGDTPNRDYIKNIISSGELLLSLTNDVLDFSRIEKGLISLNIEPMSFRTMFTELEYHYERRCKEKGLCLTIRLDEFLSNNMVECDELRVRQVLLNLLNNASKYTETGFIKLSARVAAEKADSVDVICTVTDSGIGIADASVIFNEFAQVTPNPPYSGGFGLGLAIVKKLVEALGGVISVESQMGQGSKFIIKFSDLKIASEAHAGESTPLHETVRFYKANLLIADYNINNLNLLKEYFIDQPITLYTADNGLRAWELIQSTDFAAIILDLKMPVLNGAELTDLIKTDDRFSSIPVIIITADITNESRQDLAAKKCDDYLLKPISKQTLFNSLKQFLSHEVINAKGPVEEQPVVAELSIPDNMENDRAKRLSDELKSLKNEKWADLEKTMIISDICSFAQDVQTVGEKYGFDGLMNWGARLNQAASNFDVTEYELMVGQFAEIIRLLENHAVQS